MKTNKTCAARGGSSSRLPSSNSNDKQLTTTMAMTTRLDSSTTTDKEKQVRDRRFTKHGYPRGVRFVPTHLELITILSHVIHGRPLHPKVAAIFHHLNILDHHPQELHDNYKRYAEHRYIYFFSRREFQKPPAGAGGGGPSSSVHKKRQRGGGQGDEDYDYENNEPRPVRLAKGGGWKPSGGGHELRWPKRQGGCVAGKMVTLVFYDHHDGGSKEQVKSEWGMHEFTVPVQPRQRAKLTRSTRLHDLALYRIYKLKSDDLETGSDDEEAAAGSKNQTLVNVSATNGHLSAPGAGQPSLGIFFTGRNQSLALATGPSTSQMPPPSQQQQHIPNNVVQAQQYYNHHQHGFGGGAAPASSAGQQHVRHAMPMPAYGSGGMPMPGRHQVFQFARPPVPGSGLPAGRQVLPFATPPGTPNFPRHRQVFQFARPPAQQMPVPPPPAASNPTYGGAGKETGGGATRSLPSAPASSTPPAPAAESTPPAEPMTATMHEAGKESETGGNLPEQDASNNNATAEAAGQHVQFADVRVKPEENMPVPPLPVPAPIEDTVPVDSYNWDHDIMDLFDERFQFSFEELFLPLLDDDELTPTQGDNSCSMELGTCP